MFHVKHFTFIESFYTTKVLNNVFSGGGVYSVTYSDGRKDVNICDSNIVSNDCCGFGVNGH